FRGKPGRWAWRLYLALAPGGPFDAAAVIRFSYTTHGLEVASDIELPELLPGRGGQTDVRIRIGAVPAARPTNVDEPGPHVFGEREATLTWEGVGAFSVRSGRHILIAPASGAEPRTL